MVETTSTMGIQISTLFTGPVIWDTAAAADAFATADSSSALSSAALLQTVLAVQVPPSEARVELALAIDAFIAGRGDEEKKAVARRLRNFSSSLLRKAFFATRAALPPPPPSRRDPFGVERGKKNLIPSPLVEEGRVRGEVLCADGGSAPDISGGNVFPSHLRSPLPNPKNDLSNGWQALEKREFENAAHFFEKAAEGFAHAEDFENAAVALGLASVLWGRKGEKQRETEAWRSALEKMEKGRSAIDPLFHLYELVGKRLTEKNLLGLAGAVFKKGAKELRKNMDDCGAGELLCRLGLVLSRSKSWVEAYVVLLKADILIRSRDLEEESPAVEAARDVQEKASVGETEQDRLNAALRFLNAVVEKLQKNKEKVLSADVRTRRAEVLIALGRVGEAAEDFAWMAKTFEERGSKKTAADFHFSAGRLWESAGDVEKALKAYRLAGYFYGTIWRLAERREVLLFRVELLRKLNRVAEAQELLDKESKQ